MDAWTIRDFEPEDLEAVVRMDSSSTTTDQLPLFALSDVVGSLLNRHPAVVAVRDGHIIGTAVARVDEDRAWVMRLSLDPEWRGSRARQRPVVSARAPAPRQRSATSERAPPRR